MKILMAFSALVILFLNVDIAAAQRVGPLEICSANDRTCQTRGTLGLACLGPESKTRKNDQWRDSGDALRVRNGHWYMYYADNGVTHQCSRVLVAHPEAGRGAQRDDVRICTGDDPSCQRRNLIGLSCLLENSAINNSAVWHHTGDGLRVVNGQWMMYYSHNNQTYICESVVVASISRKNSDPGIARVCSGGDRKCQTKSTVPLSCDIDDHRFGSPRNWHHNGRAMRLKNGNWEMRLPAGNVYKCRNVVVATIKASQNPNPRPVSRPVLPRGAVVLFDRRNCPNGWSWVGSVEARRSPVFGMSYCRLDRSN